MAAASTSEEGSPFRLDDAIAPRACATPWEGYCFMALCKSSNFQSALTAHSYLICEDHLELSRLPWVCDRLLSPVPSSLNRPNLSPLPLATFSLGLLGHIP